MARAVTDAQRRAQAEQLRLYGAPLGDLLRDVAGVLGLSQGRLAGVLGISAPMVSQLASGHRTKIGNPAAVARLQRLVELAAEVRDGALGAEEALAVLAEETEGPLLTRSTRISPRRGAETVQRLFRAVAPASDYLAAAELLGERYPEVAELVRVYGAGRLSAAEEHFGRALAP
ncbi:DNA-binding protein [Nocardioides caldifontis]|uniref:DNA-binding protein n=1 Tax=Nocardioides caldifontis TaxID=2588938 RepID=UPI0011DFF57F|nr:DNA-binding protein [Nocardioides caldifontis]